MESPDGKPVLDVVHDDDVLVVTGAPADVTSYALDLGLAVSMIGSGDAQDLLTREAGVAEVVVPPRSSLVGERVYPGMKRQHDLVILAVQRLGKDLGDGPMELAEGDAILLHGRWSALDQLNRDRDVLLVDSPDLVRRQAVPWGPKATRAVLVLAGLVAMLGLRTGAARDRRTGRGRRDGAGPGGHRRRRPTAPSPGRPWSWSAP